MLKNIALILTLSATFSIATDQEKKTELFPGKLLLQVNSSDGSSGGQDQNQEPQDQNVKQTIKFLDLQNSNSQKIVTNTQQDKYLNQDPKNTQQGIMGGPLLDSSEITTDQKIPGDSYSEDEYQQELDSANNYIAQLQRKINKLSLTNQQQTTKISELEKKLEKLGNKEQ